MGTVWDGHDELLRRNVAVKEVRPPAGLSEAERAELVERTRREARAAAAVTSPAVMTVFDVVEEGERTWIVMERLSSRTLADLIREEGPLPPAEAAGIGLAVLDALDAAHAAGVLHRDVKPANVLRGPGNRIVLADFGIAQAVGETSITQTGMVLGSPAYLAPERARGAPASPASDLWGLGALLFAAVEGFPPFDRGDALATLTAVVSDDVPPRPHAGELEPVVAGLLRKDPQERLTSAQVRPLLQRAARGGPERSAARWAPAAAPPAAAPGAQSVSTTQPLPLAQVPVPSGPPAGPAGAPPAGRGAGAPAAGHGGRRSRALVPAVLAAVVAAGAVAFAVQAGDDDPAGAPANGGPASAPAAPGAASPEESAAPEEVVPEQDDSADGAEAPGTEEPSREAPKSPAEGSSADGESGDSEPGDSGSGTSGSGNSGNGGSGDGDASPAAAGQLPAGWESYTDDSGFSIGVPAGWRTERKGQRVYLRDPGSSRYLLVDQTDEPKPDPLEDWRALEPTLAERFDGYQRVRLERVQVDYAEDAADLEFRYGKDGRTHVIDRNLVTGPDKAYALYWSAPHEDWPEQRRLFETLATTFTPAGR